MNGKKSKNAPMNDSKYSLWTLPSSQWQAPEGFAHITNKNIINIKEVLEQAKASLKSRLSAYETPVTEDVLNKIVS